MNADLARAFLLTQQLLTVFWEWLQRLGPLLVLLAAWLAYYLPAKRRAREAHHEAIKKRVLEPLLERVNFQLSVLEQKVPPIVVDVEMLPGEDPRPRVVDPPPQPQQFVLRATILGELPTYPLLGVAKFAPIHRLLYACTKTSHLPDVVLRFEALEGRLRQYCNDCLRVAVRLQQKFTEKAPVPATLSDRPTTGSWLNPARLALYILCYGLGVDRSPLRKSSNGMLLEAPGTPIAARGMPEQIDACVALVEDLLPDDGSVAALLDQARLLVPEAEELAAEIRARLLMAHLPGRCRYLRL
jgi:hypothetical protein